VKCMRTYRGIYVPTRDTPRDPYTQSSTFGRVSHVYSFGMTARDMPSGHSSALHTAAPGSIESEITSLWRGGDIYIRTERELAVDTSSNEDEDHCAEQFRSGLPNILSEAPCVSGKKAMMLWRCMLTVFLPTGLDIECETSPLDLGRSNQTGILAVRPCNSWVILHFC